MIYKTKHGDIELSGDPHMEAELAKCGSYMFRDVEACFPFAHDTVLDIGAHVGLWAIPVSKHAHVIAIEGNQTTAQQLKANVERNNANVSVVESIIGNPSKKYSESGGPSGTNHYLEGGEREALPLDHFCTPLPSLIKIDVEGMEPEVLASGKQMLAHKPKIFLEVNPKMLKRHGYTSRDIEAQLHGYNFYRFDDEFYRITHLMNSFYNVLCVSKDDTQPPAKSFLSFIYKKLLARLRK
jgi:FkbM family methyltransferase